MNRLLITNAKALVQVRENVTSPIKGKDLSHLPMLPNAWLLVENEHIVDYGSMDDCPQLEAQIVNAEERYVFPSWVDSHTHLVFAATRENDFVQRISGMSYAEIAAKGGGILNSAKRLQESDFDSLYEEAAARLTQLIRWGTGAIEIKSGYGLSQESEIKMLKVIQKLKQNFPIPIKATFLGAHALPKIYAEERSAYLQLLIDKVLPQIHSEKLADYIDVFCEKGFFSVAETEQMLQVGNKYGLKGKIHTNQFNCMGGIQAAIKHNALSVDHLEVVNKEEIIAMQNAPILPVLLPSAPFFLSDHYPPARQLIEAKLPVTLASDYNPGTSPSGKMAFVVALACIKMKMLPEEAINAATINAAFALELENKVGSIGRGKLANLFITKPMPSLAYLPYAFTEKIEETIIINGKIIA